MMVLMLELPEDISNQGEDRSIEWDQMLVKNAVEYNADEDGGDADDNDENYGADDDNDDNGEDVIGDNVDDSVTSRGTQSYEYPAPALFCRADSETFARQFSTLCSHRLTLKTLDNRYSAHSNSDDS